MHFNVGIFLHFDVPMYNDGLVSYFKNSHLLGYPIKIVNSIIEGAGENKINFSIEEVNLIYSWYRDTLDFHNIDF